MTEKITAEQARAYAYLAACESYVYKNIKARAVEKGFQADIFYPEVVARTATPYKSVVTCFEEIIIPNLKKDGFSVYPNEHFTGKAGISIMWSQS